MARLAISQKTITDITDGYTINLVPNSGTFSTNNNKICEADTSFTVNINAFQGSASISSDVEVDLTGITVNRIYNGSTSAASPTYYSVAATSGTGSIKKFPLTITVHGTDTQTSGKAACEADALLFNIPVYVEGTPTNSTADDDVIMNITFVATGSQTGAAGQSGTSSYTWIRYASSATPTWADTSTNPAGKSYIGFAKTTTNVEPTGDPDDYAPWTKFVGKDGENGDDAYTFIIKSSNGDVFRNNSGSTTITLYIYKSDMQRMTAAAFQTETGGVLKWFKDEVPTSGDTGKIESSIDTDGNSYITVNASSVVNIASYFVILDK
jgi:hypothetical protein